MIHSWAVFVAMVVTPIAIWALHQLFSVQRKRVQEYELWTRVMALSGVGRFNWLRNDTVWFDAVGAEMVGISPMDGAHPHSRWVELLEQDEADTVMDLLATSVVRRTRFARASKYTNGRTILSVGTVSANGSKMMGLLIDITHLTLAVSTAAKAESVERERLQSAIRFVTREKVDALMARMEMADADQ